SQRRSQSAVLDDSLIQSRDAAPVVDRIPISVDVRGANGAEICGPRAPRELLSEKPCLPIDADAVLPADLAVDVVGTRPFDRDVRLGVPPTEDAPRIREWFALDGPFLFG